MYFAITETELELPATTTCTAKVEPVKVHISTRPMIHADEHMEQLKERLAERRRMVEEQLTQPEDPPAYSETDDTFESESESESEWSASYISELDTFEQVRLYTLPGLPLGRRASEGDCYNDLEAYNSLETLSDSCVKMTTFVPPPTPEPVQVAPADEEEPEITLESIIQQLTELTASFPTVPSTPPPLPSVPSPIPSIVSERLNWEISDAYSLSYVSELELADLSDLSDLTESSDESSSASYDSYDTEPESSYEYSYEYSELSDE
jgi:hypothetical protein